MFEAAVTKFVKSVGKETLFAVPELNEASNCKPLNVVVKKRRRWCWQSNHYYITEFNLQDILAKTDPIDVERGTSELVTYNTKHKFSAKGKIGAKLKSIFEVELDTSDVLEVEANLGKVNKTTIAIPKLMSSLDGRAIDLEHPFVKEVRENPRKVLCLITEVAAIEQPATLVTHVQLSGEEKAGAEKLAAANEDASIADDKSKNFTIPAGTAVAFSVCELEVEATGALKVVLGTDKSGGFDTVDTGTVVPLEPLKDEAFDIISNTIVKLEIDTRKKLATSVQHICQSPNDIETLLLQLKAAEGEGQEAMKSVAIIDMQKKLASQQEHWQFVLELTGCKFSKNEMMLPEESTATMDGFRCLFEALIELDDDSTITFSSLNVNFCKPLLHAICRMLTKQKVTTSDEEISMMYTTQTCGQDFLEGLNITADSNGTLELQGNNSAEIEGAGRAIYALWWDAEEPKSVKSRAKSSGFKCTCL